MKFTDLGLSPGVMKAVTEMGFTELTPIQEQTFALIRGGRDLIALAETGSGKTSACGIPLAEKVDSGPRHSGPDPVPTRTGPSMDELELIGR
jgi:ATP-dependent RNA helicase DeaD